MRIGFNKSNPEDIDNIAPGLIITLIYKELTAMTISNNITSNLKSNPEGLTKYIPGMEIISSVAEKRCSVCGELLPLTDEFFNRKNKKHGSRDGFRSDCRECRNAKRRASVKNNKNHYVEYRKEYDKNNPEKVAKRQETQRLRKNKHTDEEIKQRKKDNAIKKKKKDLEIKAKKKERKGDIFGMKKCTQCGEFKLNNEKFFHFRTDYTQPDFRRVCIVCVSKESIKRKLNLVLFSSPVFKRLSTYEDVRRDPDNLKFGQVKCAYCGKWINTNRRSAGARLEAIDNINKGEGRIYCPGDQCREACPTYKQQRYPRGFKKNSSREVDPLIRQMCMARDKYTCQRCGLSGDGVVLHAHHIEGYAQNKMLGNDIDNVITYCKECHAAVHKKPGCGYYEMRDEKHNCL